MSATALDAALDVDLASVPACDRRKCQQPAAYRRRAVCGCVILVCEHHAATVERPLNALWMPRWECPWCGTVFGEGFGYEFWCLIPL